MLIFCSFESSHHDSTRVVQKEILAHCCEIAKIFESQGPSLYQKFETMFGAFRDYDDFRTNEGHLRSGPLTKCIFYGVS